MSDLDGLRIPEHVAIILDGNGRWAKAHGVPRSMGHKQGCTTLEGILEDAARMGIRYLTVYAFSTENWKRSAEEVDALMQLFRYYTKKILKKATENNIRIKMIGERSRFDQDLIDSINTLEEATRENTGMTLVFAVNYGSRDEIVRGTKKLLADYKAGKFELDDLNEKMFSSYLDTKDIPDPDLLIRPSGELRLSNFLMWQSAYTEFYFTPVLWPDFTRDELVKAIEHYNRRERRFGGR